MTAWGWLATALAASPSAEAERLAARVRELTPLAEAIVVDGATEDWASLYHVRGEQGAVRSIAVAPTDAALTVKVQLAAPLGEDALWLAIDTVDEPQFDGALEITMAGTRLRSFGHRGLVPAPFVTVAAQGSDVEIRVPWTALRAAAPSGHELGRAPGDRIRVRASRWVDGTKVDSGLAVGSYRLSPTVRFDPPPPPRDIPSVRAELPVIGTWYLAQGAQSGKTHARAWAYDITIRDTSFQARYGERLVSNVYCWDQPLFSPQRGTVKGVRTGFPDQPLDTPGKGNESNLVRIDFDDGTRMTAQHLRQGTVAVQRRQRVKPGALLGHVGNSGNSSGPHIHLAWATRSGVTSPVQLADVVVSLNPTPDDPWQRQLDQWEPAAGFFVRRARQLGTR